MIETDRADHSRAKLDHDLIASITRLELHKPTYSSSRASSSLHKLGLEPDSSQARSFAICFFSQPFISNPTKSQPGKKQEETG